MLWQHQVVEIFSLRTLYWKLIPILHLYKSEYMLSSLYLELLPTFMLCNLIDNVYNGRTSISQYSRDLTARFTRFCPMELLEIIDPFERNVFLRGA